MPTPKIPADVLKTEKRLIRRLSNAFKDLAGLISTAVKGGELSNDLIIQLSFDKIVPEVTQELNKVYQRAGKRIKKQMQLVTTDDYVVQEAIRYMQRKNTVLLGKDAGSITQTTKEHINRITIEGVQSGASYTAIATTIENQVQAGILSKARAELIAIHEIGEAYEEARLTTLKKSLQETGDKAEKIRDTVDDSKVTDECRANEAQGRILLEQPFLSGDMNPKRKGNPRCRCTANYRTI